MSNKKYLCIQRSTPKDASQQQEAPSPEKMQQMYAKFNAWKEKYQESIVDMGGPLGSGAVVKHDEVVDGPFSGSQEVVGGYMIVTAPNIEQATEIAQQSPGVFPGSSVEVREIK